MAHARPGNAGGAVLDPAVGQPQQTWLVSDAVILFASAPP
jgi:hypothetical protein